MFVLNFDCIDAMKNVNKFQELDYTRIIVNPTCIETDRQYTCTSTQIQKIINEHSITPG